MTLNLAHTGRIVRLALGVLFVGLALWSDIWIIEGMTRKTAILIGGLALIGSVWFRFCSIARLFNIMTCRA